MRALLGPLLCIGLAACLHLAPTVTDLSDLEEDEAVLVGRVELIPPIGPGDQHVADDRLRNKVFVLIDDRYRVLETPVGLGDLRGSVEVPFGETFYVRVPRRVRHVLGCMFFLQHDGVNYEQAYLPGGLRVTVAPDEGAVYMGTVRYHRNEFFEVEDAEIVDDYEHHAELFRKRFGPSAQLAKRLAIARPSVPVE